VAEKFEAMVRFGEANGRMKDFWDLNYMIAEFEFDGELLQSALRATFENRRSTFPTVLPIALRDEFVENAMVATRWTAFINRNRIERSKELSEVIRQLRAFLEPIIKAEAARNLFSMSWQPGRGWS